MHTQHGKALLIHYTDSDSDGELNIRAHKIRIITPASTHSGKMQKERPEILALYSSCEINGIHFLILTMHHLRSASLVFKFHTTV